MHDVLKHIQTRSTKTLRVYKKELYSPFNLYAESLVELAFPGFLQKKQGARYE
jgi:hypothetical protein